MKSRNKGDIVAMQLLKLLLLQPSRLTFKGIRKSLFSGIYFEVYTAIQKAWMLDQTPTSEVLLTMGMSDDANSLVTVLDEYEEPGLAIADAVAMLEDLRLREDFASLCISGHDKIHTAESGREIVREFQAKAIDLTSSELVGAKSGGDFSAINARMQWQAMNPGKIFGIQTGFRKLDMQINGLQPKLYLIGARPSVGKTAISGDITTNICDAPGNECHVIDITIEMDDEELRDRAVAKMSGVGLTSYRTTPYTPTEIKAVLSAQRKITTWNWHIYDGAVSIDDIEAIAYTAKRMYGNVLIKVDYIQLVTGGKGGNKNEQVGNISGRLKLLSKAIKSPVIALAQLRRLESRFDQAARKTVHKKPELDDLRDSGSLEQDADVAMLLDRNILDEPDTATLIVAKQRSGPTHKGIALDYHKETTSFSETL